jgi:hypothetical protein
MLDFATRNMLRNAFLSLGFKLLTSKKIVARDLIQELELMIVDIKSRNPGV